MNHYIYIISTVLCTIFMAYAAETYKTKDIRIAAHIVISVMPIVNTLFLITIAYLAITQDE